MSKSDDNAALETGSGIYRKLSPKLLSIVLVVLWALGGVLCGAVWDDARDLTKRVAVLEAYRESDLSRYDDLKQAIQEIRGDIKELLREIRK